MTEYFYCKSWFRAKKRPTTPYTETAARELHAQRKSYCVLVSSADRPSCFLEITSDFVGVGFLDEHLRENLSYQFQEKEPGKLFLTMAVSRDFDNATNVVMQGTTYLFDLDGTLNIRKETFIPRHMLEVADGTYAPASHWESYPDFGGYDGFTRRER